MASIRKRSGKYHTQVRKHGKTITKTFINKSDALRWAKEQEVKIEQGIYFPQHEKVTLSFLLNRWEKDILMNLKSYPVDKYKVAFLQRRIGHFYLHDVNTNMLVNYRETRSEEVSNQTVKHELSIIRRAMKKGIEWGYLNSVPYITLPSLKGTARNRRLKSEELTYLIDSLNPYLQHVVILLIETAMRRGELAALKISNIDIDERLVLLEDTKNGENRTIPLSNRALTAITYLIQHAHSEMLLNYSKCWLTEKFIIHCKKIGIENFRLHDLRHEGVSKLFEKGLNVIEVSSISGHRDLSMLKRYTHINPVTLLAKIN